MRRHRPGRPPVDKGVPPSDMLPSLLQLFLFKPILLTVLVQLDEHDLRRQVSAMRWKGRRRPSWGSKSGEQTCCIPGYSCNKTNDYYSQCDPLPICSNARYGQCGGVDDDNKPWLEHHSGCCPPDFSCQYVNPYFSQCLWNKSSVQYASHKAAGKLTISGALPTSDADFLWSIAHSVGKKSLSASAQQLAAASS